MRGLEHEYVMFQAPRFQGLQAGGVSQPFHEKESQVDAENERDKGQNYPLIGEAVTARYTAGWGHRYTSGTR